MFLKYKIVGIILMSGLVFNILVCKFLILEIRIFQLVLIFVNESSVMSLKFLT